MMSDRGFEISVIITCYNYAKYLKGCVESVLAQTFQDLEIIVVNDGSTDNTDEVIGEFKTCEKLHYIKQENRGQANAKNTGIKNAKGKYIAFLDADDLWEKEKLEKQMPLFSSHSIGVVFSRAKYIDEKGMPVNVKSPRGHLLPRRGKVTDFLFLDNFIPFSSSIVRRKCLRTFGGFDESLKMGIDWDLWLRISIHYEFAYVDEPLLMYRVGHSGQMSENTEERQRCSDRIMTKFLVAHCDKISRATIRKAFCYTYCNRGEYYFNKDILRSARYFANAVKVDPFGGLSFRRIGRMLIRSFMRRPLNLLKRGR